MKKNLVFISTVILLVGVFLLITFLSNGKYYNNSDYNKDLLKLSENYDSNTIVLCEEIPIKEIFIPNYFLSFAGRPFFYTDIEKHVKIENVQQTKYGFNIIYKSKKQTLLIATKPDGQIINMAYFGQALYSSEDYFDIKKGASLEEVKKILPNTYLLTKSAEIFNSSSSELEKPYIEVVCEDGRFYSVYFIKKNGIYYVEDKSEFDFLDEDVMKSWNKLIKKTGNGSMS